LDTFVNLLSYLVSVTDILFITISEHIGNSTYHPPWH